MCTGFEISLPVGFSEVRAAKMLEVVIDEAEERVAFDVCSILPVKKKK